MARAQTGDQQAYARLLKAVIPVIRGAVRRRIADEGLREDVVQETLLAIHRIRDTYNPDRPILPWVIAIASARTIDALRQRGRRLDREVQDDEIVLASADPDALQLIESFAVRKELDRLLGRLPDRQRQIVELVRLQEMSLIDAAAASSLSIPAVKALLHRAFRALRQHGESEHV